VPVPVPVHGLYQSAGGSGLDGGGHDHARLIERDPAGLERRRIVTPGANHLVVPEGLGQVQGGAACHAEGQPASDHGRSLTITADL